jgi:hypothetical protein
MKAAQDEGVQCLVQLRLKPIQLYADTIREFCGFLARAGDDELAQRVALIVDELVENAVRHGDDQELELLIERRTDAVIVRVTNTTSSDRAQKLRRAFDEQANYSPVEAYERALRHAAALPWSETGLGFPRVRYEGKVDLELRTYPGRVAITARGPL